MQSTPLNEWCVNGLASAQAVRGTAIRIAKVGSIVVRVLLLTAALGSSVQAHDADEMADVHAHHHHSMSPDVKRSTAGYTVPDIKLVRDDGKSVDLRAEMDDGRPVVLSFIYTTCTSICPVTSQTLSELQDKLGAAATTVHLMSISIDPEQDTPARLRDYAMKYGAGPEWQHYTGTVAASNAAQRSFGVYAGDKMSHVPVTLLRPALGGHWVRLDGFATSDQLLAELHSVVASR